VRKIMKESMENILEAGSQTYILDSAIAGTNMTLMATALGIGSCWIGAFEEKALRSILHIPENLKIIALITFGYEAGKASVVGKLLRVLFNKR